MKILTVSQLFYPTPGSKNAIFAPGMIAAQIAQGLQKLGHHVKVYASADSHLDGVDVETLGIKSTGELTDSLGKGVSYRFFQHELLMFSAAFDVFSECIIYLKIILLQK